MKKQITIYHKKYLPITETFIYRQMQGLSDYFDVHVITNEFDNIDEYPGINPVLVPRKGRFEKLFNCEKRFFDKNLKKTKLFHVNFGNIAVEMEHYATSRGIPTTAYFLGIDSSAALADNAYCDKLKKSNFSTVFVNSVDMKRRIAPYLPSETYCKVVYCGIPLERFPFNLRHSVPSGAIFLQICRLIEKKGVDCTLHVFKKYIDKIDSNAKLIIAGDGPLRLRLQNLAHELNLGDHVTFIGPVGYRKYIELLRRADIFIHPSVTADDGDMEGLPTVLCEAMACGIPVISTRHSGIPELITECENGFLADERDVNGLYECLVSLRKADVKMISLNARRMVEMKFDNVKTIRLMADYMNDIIL